MLSRKSVGRLLSILVAGSMLLKGAIPATTQDPPPGDGMMKARMTQAERQAAADRVKALRAAAGGVRPQSVPTPEPGGVPDYFGIYPNYATSQLPEIDGSGNVITGTGIRKFVNSLPGLGAANANDLGQYMPVAIPDITSYPGSDYYEIGLVQYTEKLHSDLPATLLRGYVQLETTVNALQSKHVALQNTKLDRGVTPVRTTEGRQVYGVDKPHYLGPAIVAQRDVPVRIKFINFLPIGSGGDLFIPTDTTVMGAGMGLQGSVTSIAITNGGSGYTSAPSVQLSGGGGTGASAVAAIAAGVVTTVTVLNGGSDYTTAPAVEFSGGEGTRAAARATIEGAPGEMYTQNRAALHLHGGVTPWISDGTPHQWTTPISEVTAYPEGVSVSNVPDMPDPGRGALTFFYSNQQSARLMFYHDHSYGITRLNVYAGEAAGYIVQDQTEKALVDSGIIPAEQIPLIIQDKTFVPKAAQIAAQDPTWDSRKYGSAGNLWFPHVYMPNQNPADPSGANAMGRWDYGPWFWPPYTKLINGPVDNPYFGAPGQPPKIPGTPNPSIVPEAYMDTPVVNGAAYPFLSLEPKAYRFRILNASNDRFWNLSMYEAKSQGPMWNANGSLLDGNAGEVAMVPAVLDPAIPFPVEWTVASDGPGIRPDVLDGRIMGVPDPRLMGPSWIQIGSEGGFLPAPVVLDPRPIGFQYNLRNIVVNNVTLHSLYLGPAERADVIVDFTQFAGKTLIVYNDAPAPVPAGDPRIDYYTGHPDYTATGGAPTTVPGYGPNTRTVMQIRIMPYRVYLPTVFRSAPITGTVSTAAAGPGAAPAVQGYGTPFNLTALMDAFATTVSHIGVFAASQDPPIVPQAAYNTAYNATYSENAFGRLADNYLDFFNGPLSGLTLTAGGAGYRAPVLSISGGGGTGAAAWAVGSVDSLIGITAGSVYTMAPTLTITDTAPGSGSGATGRATVSITGLRLTNPGADYSSAPTVTITDGGGTGSGAGAVATIRVQTVAVLSRGSGYVAPLVTIVDSQGGTGLTIPGTARVVAGEITEITIDAPAAPTGFKAPVVVIDPQGSGSGALAEARGYVDSLALTPGVGYTRPLVGFTGGGSPATPAAASTTGVVDFVGLVTPGGGYHAPLVQFSGGLGTGGTVATARATIRVTGFSNFSGGSGYTSAPTVTISDSAPGAGSGATAVAIGLHIFLGQKTIQELFEMQYGRMNATLGIELPFTDMTKQTTIPFGFVDPPTESLSESDLAVPIGTPSADGTQIWKITHNGVDTHVVHFHLFSVQIVNRVGWDGAIRPPAPEELGWKETMKMHPLEIIFVAMRPVAPKLPFGLPDSIRTFDVTAPIGSSAGFLGIDPTTGTPVVVKNRVANFGWEYVWHCHILGHEENDMMRPMILGVARSAPGAPVLSATLAGAQVNLQWIDDTPATPANLGNAANEIGFRIYRDGGSGPVQIATALANRTTYVDTPGAPGTYAYTVTAWNAGGATASNAVTLAVP
jgi:FtsP/CotA-like multicopper oxidase with cupredoxin domain